MERRKFITATSLITAGLAINSKIALAEPAEHDHKEHNHPTKYKSLADSSSKCVLDGENNLRHCYGMVSMGDTSMANCIKLTNDTIAACRALEALAAADSHHTVAMAKVVEQICSECMKECEKFLNFAECKAMAEACKNCAEECKKVKA
jgi:Cys-rich four helix bundle protein (predicted Tat secretion target)